ncbi:MAG: hypothetical protein ACRECF_03670 [Methyloceanibacter sp.]
MRVTDHHTIDVSGRFGKHDHGLFGGCLFCNEPVTISEDFEVVQSHGVIQLAHCACLEEHAAAKPETEAAQ